MAIWRQYGTWHIGIWHMEYEYEYGIWNRHMAYGIWHMAYANAHRTCTKTIKASQPCIHFFHTHTHRQGCWPM